MLKNEVKDISDESNGVFAFVYKDNTFEFSSYQEMECWLLECDVTDLDNIINEYS